MDGDSSLAIAVRGRNTTIAEIAEFLGISPQMINGDVVAGCPVIRKGVGGQFPTILNSYEWYTWKNARIRAEKRGTRIGGGVSGDPRDRALEATAAKREAEVAKMRGELVPLDSIIPLIEDGLISLRTKIDSIEEDLTAEYGKELAREIQDRIITFINGVVENIVDEAENLEK